MKIVATGDSILNCDLSSIDHPRFLRLRELVQGADIAFTNLENVTPGVMPVPGAGVGHLMLAAPESALDQLNWFGFNIYNAAMNHAYDFSPSGLTTTIEAMEKRDMVFAGVGRDLTNASKPAYLKTSAGSAALIGATSSSADLNRAAPAAPTFSPRAGVNPLRFSTIFEVDEQNFEALEKLDAALGTAETTAWLRHLGVRGPIKKGDAATLSFLGKTFRLSERNHVNSEPREEDMIRLCAAIREARGDGAQVIVVSLHSHEGDADGWNSPRAADFLTKACHRLVDEGADIIIGHGPHMLRGIEIYKGAPIFYSLGNFFFMTDAFLDITPEIYMLYGMPADSNDPHELHRRRSQTETGAKAGFHSDRRFGAGVVVDIEYHGRGDWDCRMYPITIGGYSDNEAPYGIPMLATEDNARWILADLVELSAEFSTPITINKDSLTATMNCLDKTTNGRN